MPRPRKCRRVCSMPQSEGFAPIGNPERCKTNTVNLRVDEYEVIRLIDLESLTQEQCAARMNIARTTVTGIYDTARQKVADALVNGKLLIIEGGDVAVCEHCENGCMGHGKHCYRLNRMNGEKS